MVANQYNVADQFVDRHVREGHGSKTAIIVAGDRSLCYADVVSEMNRVGNGLRRIGVQPQQRVLLILPDGLEFVAAYFGAMKIGAIAVPTSTAVRGDEYGYFLAESRPSAMIVHSSLWERVEPAIASRSDAPPIILYGGELHGALSWDRWLADAPTELAAEPTATDSVAFWLWTSGSTGRAKAALHLHRDWQFCCEHYARGVLEMGPTDVTFSSSKLFHAYGLGNSLMFPFYVGATTILSSAKSNPARVLETAQRYRPTLFFSVPTLYAAMLQEADECSYDLSSVRLAISAAEHLSADIFLRWKSRFGIEILDGIGSTEMLHIYLSARAGKVKPGSTGTPVEGYSIRIVDENGHDCPALKVGDMLVSGESVTPGYWNHPELTGERMRGKWFFTGDKFWMDENGFYGYAGRADDLFRVSGKWVAPTEVEAVLIAHPSVLEAAVVAHREGTGILSPRAYVVLKNGGRSDAQLISELQDLVKHRLPPYKCPCRIHVVEDLPKTATGKILRYQLREASLAAPGA
jgi:benzoate-CoA ligase family protein